MYHNDGELLKLMESENKKIKLVDSHIKHVKLIEELDNEIRKVESMLSEGLGSFIGKAAGAIPRAAGSIIGGAAHGAGNFVQGAAKGVSSAVQGVGKGIGAVGGAGGTLVKAPFQAAGHVYKGTMKPWREDNEENEEDDESPESVGCKLASSGIKIGDQDLMNSSYTPEQKKYYTRVLEGYVFKLKSIKLNEELDYEIRKIESILENKQQLDELLGALAAPLVSGAGWLGGQALDLAGGIAGGTLSAAGSLAKGTGNAIGSIAKGTVDAVGGTVKGVKSAVKGVKSAVKDANESNEENEEFSDDESRDMGRKLARSGTGLNLVSSNGVGTGFKPPVRTNSKLVDFHTRAKRKHFKNVIEGYLAELKRMRV